AVNYSTTQASYPQAPRATSTRAYLELLRVEVTAFHPLRSVARPQRLVSVALFLALYLSAFSGRPLTVTLLCGVRTFLPPPCRRPAVVLSCFSRHCSLPAACLQYHVPVDRAFAHNHTYK